MACWPEVEGAPNRSWADWGSAVVGMSPNRSAAVWLTGGAVGWWVFRSNPPNPARSISSFSEIYSAGLDVFSYCFWLLN